MATRLRVVSIAPCSDAYFALLRRSRISGSGRARAGGAGGRAARQHKIETVGKLRWTPGDGAAVRDFRVSRADDIAEVYRIPIRARALPYRKVWTPSARRICAGGVCAGPGPSAEITRGLLFGVARYGGVTSAPGVTGKTASHALTSVTRCLHSTPEGPGNPHRCRDAH